VGRYPTIHGLLGVGATIFASPTAKVFKPKRDLGSRTSAPMSCGGGADAVFNPQAVALPHVAWGRQSRSDISVYTERDALRKGGVFFCAWGII
jgi:hypothetical protein